MTTTNIVPRAAEFANLSHAGQKRKYLNTPYFEHCEEVATLIARHVRDEEVVAAAYLHDCIEDCGVSFGRLYQRFGIRVARLVLQCSDISQPKDGNRAARKEIDRAWYCSAEPDAKSIKLADLISNTATIVEFDLDFAQMYLHEKKLLLPGLVDGNEKLFLAANEQLTNALLKLQSKTM